MSRSTRTTAAKKSSSAELQIANSGAPSAKPRPAKRKKRGNATARRSKAKAPAVANPLPPAIEVELPGETQAHVPPNSPSPMSLPPSPADSSTGLPDSSTETVQLSSESERLLSQVPEIIGDAAESTETAGQGDGEGSPDDAIAALMQQIAFEPQDVQDQVGELFEWLAERFKSDHWKLTERQSRMLGRPTAQLLNSLWAKLQTILPDVLGRWCVETPGAAAFIFACGIVVVPKVTKQVGISRARRRDNAAQKLVRPGASHGPQSVPQSKPQPRTASNMIHMDGQ